jgi:NAD(P)-dependent dehydrogenase (short-subunit alcohol dehydrogenase family)
MKYILVTGAYGGMGEQAVRLFVENGYTVFALDRNVGEKADGIIPVLADITNIDCLQTAFETVKSFTDELFAIVHFAGTYTLDSLVEMNEETFDRTFKINLYGAFYVNKIFLPLLKDNSKIVITTSELAPLDPLPFTGIYAITKSALDGYAYSLKMELQLLNIHVSVIRAGAVSTGMLGASTDALNRFCDGTELYKVNAKRFKDIVNRVEAKCVPPKKVAEKALKILKTKTPRFVYTLNRNKLLLLLDVLPRWLRFKIIKYILRNGRD